MEFWARSRFTVLLAILVLCNVAQMTTIGYYHDPFLLKLLGAVFLFIAILSLCAERRSRTMALILGLPAAGLALSTTFFLGRAEHILWIASHASSMLFLAFVIGVILQTLIMRPNVTRDSIAGAFCGYVLIGVLFAEAYCLMDVGDPHSFQLATATPSWDEDPLRRWLMLEYFSFTTLTTLGFGDVIPMSPAARCLAVWEAVCGQFYLAVLVAGLVSLRASRTSNA